ncbi:MAG: ferritin-like domain-containing protein [Fimbriimonas sp.]
METMKELIEECLKDVLSAEKQLVKAMPKLAKAAQNPELKQSILTHLEETKEQVKRIEACMKDLGIKGNMFCKGMGGIIEECNEHLEEAKPGPVADAMIIGLAQKAEHYEICGYGTMFEYMKAAGMHDVVERLKPNMAEEEKTDKLLSQLAESSINPQAASFNPEEAKEAKKPAAKKASASASNGKASSAKAAKPKAKPAAKKTRQLEGSAR